MTRLPYRLPEYAPRIAWASVQARDVWEPRINALSAIHPELERELVIQRHRPSAFQCVSPTDLPELLKTLAPHGVCVLPLTRTPRIDGYRSVTPATGELHDYRVAITRPEHAAEWAGAWERGDNDAIGRLLDYPECCRAFFERVWVQERWIDTTWPMSQPHDASRATSGRAYGAPDTARSTARERDSRSEGAERPNEAGREGVEVTGSVNMLWRWLGVRLVSHLPCSCDCQASAHMGRQALQVMAGRWPQEAAWLREILSWPVKWTALHGIAEITSPIHRMSVATDATRERLDVRYIGTGYPREGAAGTGFPHRPVTTPQAMIQIARLSALNPAVNGFTSFEAMNAAHARLLAVAGGPFNTVLDLGCGDGTLMSRLPAKRRVGLESDPTRAALAAKKVDRVVVGDCVDAITVGALLDDERPDLVIAQRDRNPVSTLSGYRVLSYSYESGAMPPCVIEVAQNVDESSIRTG